MFHKAVKLDFLEGTLLEILFQDGQVKRYDVGVLFDKYPTMKELLDRKLFLSGKLVGNYGIIWNDETDLEVETVYEDGVTVRTEKVLDVTDGSAARAVAYARSIAGMSQKELAAKSKIDQSDISKIERGLSNPSVSTLERLAHALGGELEITVRFRENTNEI